MRIIQRYILKELLLPTLLCLITLSFIFMAGYLVKAADMIIGKGVSLFYTLKILILAFPSVFSYTAPLSLLTGTLIVYGGFSQNNELRAMKAAGMQPFKFMIPSLIIGISLSLLMFVFNDQITPKSRFELRKSVKRLAMQHPLALIQPGQFVQLTDEIVFFVKKVEDQEMQEIVAYEGVDSDNPVRTIIAERGEVITHQESGKLEINLYDGSISESQGEGVNSVQFETFTFPTFGKEDLRMIKKKTKDLTLAEILLKLKKPGISEETKKKLKISFHKRISFSLAAFIFVFLGIPIAVIVRRGEVIVSFVIAMVFAVGYYVFFVLAHSIASQGILPAALSLWLPNILLFLLGLWLMRKAILS